MLDKGESVLMQRCQVTVFGWTQNGDLSFFVCVSCSCKVASLNLVQFQSIRMHRAMQCNDVSVEMLNVTVAGDGSRKYGCRSEHCINYASSPGPLSVLYAMPTQNLLE